MAALTDTSPEAEQVLRASLRRMPFARRWAVLGDLYNTGRMLHRMGYRSRNPMATNDDIIADWRRQALDGLDVPPMAHSTMDQTDANLKILREVITAFERLGIPYAIGGSLASARYGKPRFTYDADLTVEPFPGLEQALVAQFAGEYYISREAVEDAVNRRASFNIIHSPSSFKVDVFVRKHRPFEQGVLSRRCAETLPDGTQVFFLSPEDILLFKLEWYRLGGERSERQWNDIRGILEVQAELLDAAYLEHWANDLGVADLLAQARSESIL